MNDREKALKLTKELDKLFSEAELPVITIIGIMEGLKFEMLNTSMDDAKQELHKLQSVKVKVE